MRRFSSIMGLLAVPTVVYVVGIVLARGRAALLTHIYLVVVSGGTVKNAKRKPFLGGK